jgi:hypothetical protein
MYFHIEVKPGGQQEKDGHAVSFLPKRLLIDKT